MSRIPLIPFFGIFVLLFSSCTVEDEVIEPMAIKDVAGLSVEKIEETWGKKLVPVEGSFRILVSKNLHPYTPPAENKLYRHGENSYTILEFSADQKLIAIHHVKG